MREEIPNDLREKVTARVVEFGSVFELIECLSAVYSNYIGDKLRARKGFRWRWRCFVRSLKIRKFDIG